MAKNNDDEAKIISAVEKSLGEPVFIGFDDKTTRIRTYLFLLSAVSIGYAWGGLKIDENSSFLGLRFEGVNDELFRIGLLATVAYLLIHFLWNSLDAFFEWRLRRSGTANARRDTNSWALGDDYEDYASNPRQSTLYNWWISEAETLEKQINRHINGARSREAAANQIVEEHADEPDIQTEVKQLQNAISQADQQINACSSMLDKLEGLCDNREIAVRLKRFDDWFMFFLQSQSIRWILIEFSLPVVLAVWAIYLLWPWPVA